MSNKVNTEREAREQFDKLRRAAQNDETLARVLSQVDDMDDLLSDVPNGESESFRLPYSSTPEIRQEDAWN